MSTPRSGRSLNWVEAACMLLIVGVVMAVSPPDRRNVAGALVLCPLSAYNAWVARNVTAYVLVGASLILIALALFLTDAAPT